MKRGFKERVILGVLFDFDGTLTLPGSIDFSWIRKAMGCPEGESILDFLSRISDKRQKEEAQRILEEKETEAAEKSRPRPGACGFVNKLKKRGVPVGIITRNSRKNVERSFENVNDLDVSSFEIVLTRDDEIPFKPDPEGIYKAAETFGCEPTAIAVVGDHRYDLEAAEAAGALSVLMENKIQYCDKNWSYDEKVGNFEELEKLLDPLLPLPQGKLPNYLLEEYLSGLPVFSEEMILSPAVGEDTAAVSLEGDSDVLVMKSDPVTFVAKKAGYYAVMINANDLATSGAKPRWFLATLLFPPETAPFQIRDILLELGARLKEHGIILCGGHTEITDAVTRPVVSGTLLGTVARNKLLKKTDMQEGDKILLTKSAGLEGTAIIAEEFSQLLYRKGMSEEEIGRAGKMRSLLSILPEAEIAADHPGVKAMHDVTEGGVATAILELALASRHQVDIELDKIPVYQETEKVCRLLSLDPLGLIGSGALLICCRAETTCSLKEKITSHGIEVNIIGEVGKPSKPGEVIEEKPVKATLNGNPVDFPDFITDELTRLY
ncbi:MAG: hypothetical protein DRP87_06550 [Spirochaetes bacterium]|nr:MAG: hypothetical protein DRP87_06550 [Spirochaetota bacterium]